jgi:hypothetical protein
MGYTASRIAKCPNLIGVNSKTLQRKAQFLKELGISQEKIATHAQLLSLCPDTIREHARALKSLGFSSEKIAARPSLLGRCPDTLLRNYRALRSLFPRRTLLIMTQLLNNNLTTVQSSVWFLHELGLNHESFASMCSTTVQCKRRKIVALLQVRYGYSVDLPVEQKRELVGKARRFIRNQPRILTMSEKKIRERFAKAA